MDSWTNAPPAPTPVGRIRAAHTKAAEEIRKVLCEAAKPLFEGSDPMTITVCASAGSDMITHRFPGFQIDGVITSVKDYIAGPGENHFGYKLVLRPNGILAYSHCGHIYEYGPKHFLFDQGKEVLPIVYCILGEQVLNTIRSLIKYREERAVQAVP